MLRKSRCSAPQRYVLSVFCEFPVFRGTAVSVWRATNRDSAVDDLWYHSSLFPVEARREEGLANKLSPSAPNGNSEKKTASKFTATESFPSVGSLASWPRPALDFGATLGQAAPYAYQQPAAVAQGAFPQYAREIGAGSWTALPKPDEADAELMALNAAVNTIPSPTFPVAAPTPVRATYRQTPSPLALPIPELPPPAATTSTVTVTATAAASQRMFHDRVMGSKITPTRPRSSLVPEKSTPLSKCGGGGMYDDGCGCGDGDGNGDFDTDESMDVELSLSPMTLRTPVGLTRSRTTSPATPTTPQYSKSRLVSDAEVDASACRNSVEGNDAPTDDEYDAMEEEEEEEEANGNTENVDAMNTRRETVAAKELAFPPPQMRTRPVVPALLRCGVASNPHSASSSPCLSRKKKTASMVELPTPFGAVTRTMSCIIPLPVETPPVSAEQLKKERLMPISRVGCPLPIVAGIHKDLLSISCVTAAALLRGEYSHLFSRVIVVDCRYDYEYEGGHIVRAYNVTLPDVERKLEELLFMDTHQARNTIVLFHCEYSETRGPTTMRAFKEMDRARNSYPQLTYDNVFLIDGGYKEFFRCHPDMCDPRGYIEMLSSQFAREQRSYAKIRTMEKQKSKIIHKRVKSMSFSRLADALEETCEVAAAAIPKPVNPLSFSQPMPFTTVPAPSRSKSPSPHTSPRLQPKDMNRPLAYVRRNKSDANYSMTIAAQAQMAQSQMPRASVPPLSLSASGSFPGAQVSPRMPSSASPRMAVAPPPLPNAPPSASFSAPFSAPLSRRELP